RGNLALRFVQRAAVMQPKWIVWENVPGVLSSGKGRDFGTFLGALGQLGYGFAYRILDAQWFGVAQRRRRVFVVGHLGDWRRAAAVLFERESVFGNPPTRGAKGQGITSSPEGIAGNVSSKWAKGTGGPAGDECYNLVAEPQAIAFGGQMSTPQVDVELSQTLQRKNPQAVATTFDWQAGGGGSDQSFRGKSRSYVVDKPECSRALTSCKTLAVAFTAKDCGGDATQDVAPTMRAMGHSGSHANGGGQLAVAFAQNSRDEVRHINGDGQIVGALSAEPGMKQQSFVAYAIDGGNQAASEEVHHSLRTGRDSGDAVAFKPSHYTRGKDGAPSEVTAPLSADADKGDQDTVIAFQQRGRDGGMQVEVRDDNLANCLRAPCGGRSGADYIARSTKLHNTSSNQSGKLYDEYTAGLDANSPPPALVHPMAVRRLTPRECERLQGFPDDFTAIQYRKKPAADGPRYRALGNSMAVPVMRWIGERIAMVDRMA
ncbi:MAG: DNA cytosine methyltransferase, partial [Alphaproteobacteria bacterium]